MHETASISDDALAARPAGAACVCERLEVHETALFVETARFFDAATARFVDAACRRRCS